jgi:hypothetical protein
VRVPPGPVQRSGRAGPRRRETSFPPRTPPSRRPTRSASATRPPLERPPPEGERRDERPVRPSSLLDITLAHRVAVQAPHPRRPASHEVGEGPPTAGPPLGGPAASDLDLSPAGCTEPVAASKLPCAAPASARRGPLSPIELTRSARAPGLAAKRGKGAFSRGSSVRVSPGPVQRSGRAGHPQAGKQISLPGRRLPAGRPAALARPARPSSAPPPKERGAKSGRSVLARCWILRLHTV